MDSAAFLHYLSTRPGYAGQIAHVEPVPRREARHAPLRHTLFNAVRECLEENGVFPLYSHQAEAADLAAEGKNVMVATASASGKTLCYNVPVMEALQTGPAAALYLFPTKALAQDQLRRLEQLFYPRLLGPGDAATFDGDTPAAERTAIRRRARILITNPDMLHVGILPNHASWSRLLRNLKYVVVDEAHTYRGIFGSNVSCVLRRLRRLCLYYHADPQFIMCSATIANPGEHAERLAGLPFSVVDDDGSPYGGKDFVFWNPPLIDDTKGLRRSGNSEAADLSAELVGHGIRTLTFAHTRRLTELIYNYTKKRLGEIDSALPGKIMPYRAGYLPEERRKIEHRLFQGDLIGVVATNALELGINIGDLDATVLSGYPGSIASTWQQAGRSGRGRGQSISFLVGFSGPLDQYFMNHPDAFFGKNYENALVNPNNHYILQAHLLCAAWEMPLSGDDCELFGFAFERERDGLLEKGLLRERNGRWYPSPSLSYPAQGVSIRSTSDDSFALIDTSAGGLLETIEASVAFFQVHPGAVYLHQGESYLVSELDIDGRTAYAAPSEVKYYTMTKEIHDLRILNVKQEKRLRGTSLKLGEVEVSINVVGFKKKLQFTDEVVGEEPLDLPPQVFPPVARWFDIAPAMAQRLAQKQ